jgi:uncharacterized protein (TIGR04255 family)
MKEAMGNGRKANMKTPGGLNLSVSQSFPKLAHAPIVEAVIHWRARAEQSFSQTLRSELETKFPHYECHEQRELFIKAEVSAKGAAAPKTAVTENWDGFRLKGKDSADGYVVQFKLDGLVVSRLAPYQDWETFATEAMRWWESYLEIAKPAVIDRLGVRFINRMNLSEGDSPSTFLKDHPRKPLDELLKSETFLYQDDYQVVGTPYRVKWVRTIQSNIEGEQSVLADIDVSCGVYAADDLSGLLGRLAEMRQLKDRLFFSSITSAAEERFGIIKEE